MTLREKLTAQMTGNVEGSDERYDEPNGAVYPDAAASPAATLEQRLSRVPYAADQNGQGGHSPSPRIPATSNEARLESRLGQKFVSTSDTSRLPLHRRISDASAIKVKTEPEDPLPIPEDPPMKASPRIPEPKADVTAQPPVSAVPPSDIKTSTAVAYQDPIPKAAQHVTPIAIPEPPKDSLPLSSLSAPPSASLPSPNAVVDMEIDVDDEPASVVFNTAQGVPNGVTSEGASPAAPKATKQLSNSVDAVLQDKNTPTPASPAKIIMASELETIARSTTTLRPELATPQVVHRADIIPAPATVITALDPGPTPGTAHISSPSIQDSRKLVAPAVSSPKAVVSVLQPVSAPPSLMNQPPPPTKHRLSLTNQNVGSLNSAVVTLSNAPPRPPPLALAPSSAPVTQRSDPVTARSHIPTPAEGIFSANLRFPLTFYLEDAPARLARIVEENGGELTSLGEALFVVLPLDKGETAKERRHRRLASGVGIHPCARVVSREWIGRSAVYGDELLDPAPFIVKLDESKDYTEVDKERQESELSSVPPSERSSAPLSRKRSYNQTSARPDPTHRPNSTQGHSAKQSHTRIPSTTSARCENDPEFEWEWESDLEDELDDDGDDVEDDQDMEIVIRPENIPSADWRRIKVIIAAFKAWDQKGGKIEFLKRLRRDEDVTNAEGIYRRYHEYIDSKVTGLARHSRNRKKRIKLEVVNNAQYN